MATRTILRIGNPILRQESRPVDDVHSEENQTLIQDMLDSMREASGAGLAAPQIGITKRVIIFGVEKNPRYPDAEPVPLTVLFNPQYEIIDKELEAAWEGCLSVPGMRGVVARPKSIRYWGMDAEGNYLEREASGFHARVFLHENDHLDGVLYVDRLVERRLFGFIEELEAAGEIPRVKKEKG